MLDMPVLDGPPVYELWTSDDPVRYFETGGLRLAATDQLLFGALPGVEDPAIPLETMTRQLYDQLFQLLKQEGYLHLFRIWNYLPGITEEVNGLERYQRFTLGRHEAFEAHGRLVEQAPAACALGTAGGLLNVSFMAARQPGRPVENPRQISAYRYPERYGPRSPTFSRALLAGLGAGSQLFISGTASIVGHESRHPGDPAAQAREALANIAQLLAEARQAGHTGAHSLKLKVYVRHAAMLSAIRPVVEAALGPHDEAIYLQAEICRRELLVEIEGAYI
jgi:enamine deaminase RidA (YjgF/YER057c/UK114 family)